MPSPSSPLPPSASLCPKYSPLPAGAFSSNAVYGARLYGMRLHPEYVPLAGPACPAVGSGGTVSLKSPLAHAAAAFEGLVAAKNGLKGLTATQVRHGAGSKPGTGAGICCCLYVAATWGRLPAAVGIPETI